MRKLYLGLAAVTVAVVGVITYKKLHKKKGEVELTELEEEIVDDDDDDIFDELDEDDCGIHAV